MIVVAGPPGSGKSTAFPVQSEGVDFFNADNRAAELNGGSFQNIPPDIRNRVNREFEDFINQRIDSRSSFAFETTLRTSVTCVQARHAYAHGFHRLMTYVGLNSAEECIQRVMNRAHHGGHSAPAELIRQSYAASIQNLGGPLNGSAACTSMTTALLTNRRAWLRCRYNRSR